MGANAFFNKLVSYGGISINDGVLRIWKDPNIFFEKSVYTTFHMEGYMALGEDFEDLLYVLGKMSGWNSSVTLGEFFGLTKRKIWTDDHSDADSFMDGATQDGWGEARITKYPERNKKVELTYEIKDKEIPFDITKKYQIKKIRYHSYVSGIIAAGTKYLTEKECNVYEEECRANNEQISICRLRSEEVSEELKSKILIDCKIEISNLYKKTATMYKSRKYEFKPFTIFKINFGDGTFKIKNYSGSVMVIISFCVLNYVLKKKITKEKYYKILDETSKKQAEIFKNQLKINSYSLKSLNSILSELSLFGMGKFEASISGPDNKIVLITVRNNPIAKDYLILFDKQSEPSDDYLCFTFMAIFKTFFNLDSQCVETACISKGDMACTFKLMVK